MISNPKLLLLFLRIYLEYQSLLDQDPRAVICNLERFEVTQWTFRISLEELGPACQRDDSVIYDGGFLLQSRPCRFNQTCLWFSYVLQVSYSPCLGYFEDILCVPTLSIGVRGHESLMTPHRMKILFDPVKFGERFILPSINSATAGLRPSRSYEEKNCL